MRARSARPRRGADRLPYFRSSGGCWTSCGAMTGLCGCGGARRQIFALDLKRRGFLAEIVKVRDILGDVDAAQRVEPAPVDREADDFLQPLDLEQHIVT